MENKRERALALHDRGLNCCQSVVLSFAGEMGLDEALIMKAAEGFGLGMGGMEGNCGALTGAIMLAGLANSDGDLLRPASKRSTYDLSLEIYERFLEKTGSTICRELRGEDTGAVLCPCSDCILAGVDVAMEVLALSNT